MSDVTFILGQVADLKSQVELQGKQLELAHRTIEEQGEAIRQVTKILDRLVTMTDPLLEGEDKGA